MKTDAKIDAAPAKADLTSLPNALECSSCGLSYCDCEVCDGSGTVQVTPWQDAPEKAE